jgi:hypothetical protein
VGRKETGKWFMDVAKYVATAVMCITIIAIGAGLYIFDHTKTGKRFFCAEDGLFIPVFFSGAYGCS